jgi:hypothetical protein
MNIMVLVFQTKTFKDGLHVHRLDLLSTCSKWNRLYPNLHGQDLVMYSASLAVDYYLSLK